MGVVVRLVPKLKNVCTAICVSSHLNSLVRSRTRPAREKVANRCRSPFTKKESACRLRCVLLYIYDCLEHCLTSDSDHCQIPEAVGVAPDSGQNMKPVGDSVVIRPATSRWGQCTFIGQSMHRLHREATCRVITETNSDICIALHHDFFLLRQPTKSSGSVDTPCPNPRPQLSPYFVNPPHH